MPWVTPEQQSALGQEILALPIPLDRLELVAQLAAYRDRIPAWDEAFARAYQDHPLALDKAAALAQVLSALAPQAKAEWLAQAAGQLGRHNWPRMSDRGAHGRSPVWQTLVAVWLELPPATGRGVWRDALPLLATRSRADLCLDLAMIAPVLLALAGPSAVYETAQAVVDVGDWWP